jgi:hypothetical protein
LGCGVWTAGFVPDLPSLSLTYKQAETGLATVIYMVLPDGPGMGTNSKPTEGAQSTAPQELALGCELGGRVDGEPDSACQCVSSHFEFPLLCSGHVKSMHLKMLVHELRQKRQPQAVSFHLPARALDSLRPQGVAVADPLESC